MNPILVIRNNLPDYRDEVIHERAELQVRLNALDEELKMLDALVDTLAAQDARNAATPTVVAP